MSDHGKETKLVLYYDGQCPLCAREIRFMQRLNKKQLVAFQDLTTPDFDPSSLGLTREEMHRYIHAKRADGALLTGMSVFREAYGLLGLGWLLAPTAWPLLRPVFDRLYLWFARNRVSIGKIFGRNCDTSCG